MKPRAFFLASFLVPLACDSRPGRPLEATVILDAAGEHDVDLAEVHVGGDGVLAVSRAGDSLHVRVDAGREGDVQVRGPGACPLVVPAKEIAAAERAVTRKLVPLLSFGPPQPQVGFGARFSVVVKRNCEGSPPALAWEQTDGPKLEEVRPGPLAFYARMPDATEILGHDPAWGIVPISARTRAEVTLAATWRDGAGTVRRREVKVAAAARARGLPNVAVGARLYLGGHGWQVRSAPQGSRAQVLIPPERERSGLPSFTPDVRGAFLLEDGEHHGLRLVAGKYDETPLDCGRSECHAAITETSRSSPMQTIFARGLGGGLGEDYPACALGCHTSGEPGLDDGGFAAVAALLGRTPRSLAASGYHDMPPALRRVSGVNCLACHGPGTVPEPEGRWALLRTGVCATCHDAPPRYGHVAAYESSRMARADADPRTRDDACARCHTTWGFLDQPERKPPAHAGAAGIGCVACHAVHPAHKDTTAFRVCAAALPREVAIPALLDGGVPESSAKSRVCLSCHAPDAAEGAPAASAAALWLGRGGLDPATGAPLHGDRPHAGVAGGCIGCHRSGPAALGKGTSHGFASDETACAACHAPKGDASIVTWARALFERLAPPAAPANDPPHAVPRKLDRSTPRGRALRNVLLVLEDRGAAAHNAPYARALLDAAERATGRGSR